MCTVPAGLASRARGHAYKGRRPRVERVNATATRVVTLTDPIDIIETKHVVIGYVSKGNTSANTQHDEEHGRLT